MKNLERIKEDISSNHAVKLWIPSSFEPRNLDSKSDYFCTNNKNFA